MLVHVTISNAGEIVESGVSTGASQPSTTTAYSLEQYAYTSDINFSNPCTYTNESATSIISNIENYPEFISLEGNRTYTLDGYGCSMSNPTGTNATYQSIISFRYYDWAHPIYWQCGNQTVSQPPYYQITVTLDLTPTGYNLANSSFESRLVPPFEGCPNFNGTS